VFDFASMHCLGAAILQLGARLGMSFLHFETARELQSTVFDWRGDTKGLCEWGSTLNPIGYSVELWLGCGKSSLQYKTCSC